MPVLLGGGTGGAGLSAEDVQALIDADVAALVDTAPATLDTLNELAAALADDQNFAATITAQLATKVALSSVGSASGVAALDATTKVPPAQLPSITAAMVAADVAVQAELDAAIATAIPLTQKAAANGVATLGGDSKVPTGQIPTITAAMVAADLATQAELDAVAALSTPAPPAFRSAVKGQATGTVDMGLPAGMQGGDLLVAYSHLHQDALGYAVVPDGWTALTTISSGSDRWHTYWKIAAANEPTSQRWVLGNTGHSINMMIAAFSGASAVEFISEQTATGVTTVVTAPAYTPEVNSLAVVLAMLSSTSYSITPGTGWTEAYDSGTPLFSGFIVTKYHASATAQSAGTAMTYSSNLGYPGKLLVIRGAGANATDLEMGMPYGTAQLDASGRLALDDYPLAATVLKTPTLPAFRSYTAGGTAAGGTPSLTKPAGTAEGDLLIAFVADLNSAAGVPNTPSGGGWTYHGFLQTGNGGAGRTYWWTKQAGAAEPATYSLTFNAGYTAAHGMFAVSGAARVNPLLVNAATTVGTPTSAPPVDLPASGDVVTESPVLQMMLSVISSTGYTFTPAAGWTEHRDGNSGNGSAVVASRRVDRLGVVPGSRAGTWSSGTINGQPVLHWVIRGDSVVMRRDEITGVVHLTEDSLKLALGTPAQSLVNRHGLWLLDPTAEEGVGAAVQFPADWRSFRCVVYWCPTTATPTGAVYWRLDGQWIDDAGTSVLASPTAGYAGSSDTVADTQYKVKRSVLTGVPSIPEALLSFNLVRLATDAADTYTADAGLLAIAFERVS